MISSTKVRINIEIPNKTSIYIKKLFVIIIEGKKEEVSKRLKQRFEYDGPFIDRMVSVDPTGYKYVDYIAKQLEKIIPKLAGEKGGLNISQQEAIQNILTPLVTWFNDNQDKITEDDIWRAETQFRESTGMVVDNIKNIADSPRDINLYDNPKFLQFVMEVVNSRKTNKELEREAKSQAERLYEDDEVLVIRPKSFAASCYYGANTKWCTAAKDNSGYFERYNRDGKLYYFINKKDNTKLALFVSNEKSKDKKIEVYNSIDKEVTLKILRTSFPNQNELIDDLIGLGDFIKILREYSRGKVDYYELRDSDSSIVKVREYTPPGQTEIVIEFENEEEFLSSLDLDDDDIWFLKMMTSSYSDYEFMDGYTIEEDFKSGYIFYYDLNDENRENFKKIAQIMYPEKEFNMDDEDYRIQVNARLIDLFPKEIDWILSEYQSEKNSEMFSAAKEDIEKDINGILEKSGLGIYSSYESVTTTVANLLWWSARLEIYKTDAKSLVNQILQTVNTGRIGGWMENQYEYQNPEYFDSESFNQYAGRQLDEILEKIDEDSTIGEFLELRDRILKKFKLNMWYVLPKDETIGFSISGFDKDKKEIIVILNKKGTYNNKRVSLSEENFYNLLYQPELFDIFGE